MSRRRELLLLGATIAVGLGLRLAAWRWHTLYPLGGDEREYFTQALTFLQGQGYRDLPLMRPPLYPIFLAIVFQLFDSQVQRVRLVQALASTVTIAAIWWMAKEAISDQLSILNKTRSEPDSTISIEPANNQAPKHFFPRSWRSWRLCGLTPSHTSRLPLVAAMLTAACWTLAANATELLTETLFVGGLTLVWAMLMRTDRLGRLRWALGAGLAVGGLALLRSVALPLVPLGGAWLLLHGWHWRDWRWRLAIAFGFGAALVIGPWTIRNTLAYGGLIVIDTTGAENLWLDNNWQARTDRDPTGREAAKRALYALGDDRLARQQLATERGIAAITSDPAGFVRKMGGEATKFVALEYFDDLRARPGIWVPPAERWLRLVLGDGLWLGLLLGGTLGLWRGMGKLGWLFVPWLIYIAVSSLIFHVELRYRLPMYPILIIATAAWLTREPRSSSASERRNGSSTRLRPRLVLAVLHVACWLGLLLLHRPYPSEALGLARKHWALWRGDAAQALRLDPGSALARVTLARDLIARGDDRAARREIEAALAAHPDQPYAHLVLGDLLRRAGEQAAAEREFGWETRSLEDLQRWSWQMLSTPPPERIVLGQADLGWLQGWHAVAANEQGWRWTTARALIKVPPTNTAPRLRLASGRPAESVPVTVRLLSATGAQLAATTVQAEAEWQELRLPAPFARSEPGAILELRTATFRPRDRDRQSDDNRRLGIKIAFVDWSRP